MVLFQSAPIVLLALGEGIIIIMGSIDLTPGSVSGLSALVTGLVTLSTGNIALAVIMAILAGLAAGAINGLLVTRFKVYSFIATLAGLEIWRAVDLTITGGSPIYGLTQYSFLMVDFHTFIPLVFIIALAITLIFWYLLTRTTWGRIIYGIGSNEEAVRLAGTHADLAKFLAFTIAGLLYGLAGVMLVATGGFFFDSWASYGDEL